RMDTDQCTVQSACADMSCSESCLIDMCPDTPLPTQIDGGVSICIALRDMFQKSIDIRTIRVSITNLQDEKKRGKQISRSPTQRASIAFQQV
ncbi:MAG: hypothetical protein ACKO2L_03050, partial [Planctomycetaceae bacterium]